MLYNRRRLSSFWVLVQNSSVGFGALDKIAFYGASIFIASMLGTKRYLYYCVVIKEIKDTHLSCGHK